MIPPVMIPPPAGGDHDSPLGLFVLGMVVALFLLGVTLSAALLAHVPL